MCGIAGIHAYHYAANLVDRDELVRIRDHMAARGPDGEGEWYSLDGRVGFGHRRLSIIDLSDTGAQPMASEDGKLHVTFNGEIYNFRELRKHLEAKGRKFRSRSDTEVLLHLYAEKGPAMVHDLRGMFAFGIWDSDKQSLFLARDPYGIKPLYYSDDGWTLRFASQVKALLAGGRVSREPDPAGWAAFYLFGSVSEPHTTYREVRQLPAGTYLFVDRLGAHSPRRYHSIASVYCEAENRKDAFEGSPDWREQIRDALLNSVRNHLVADVPVGAFLSAGIDSGALVGLMRDAGQTDIQTVTLAFEEFRGSREDEAPIAAEVAKLYGTRHTTRTVTEKEFLADLPRILDAMDQPTIDGINTWFVSKAARELGLKVAISGLGGDELFGGYPSFADIPRCVRWMAVPSRAPLLGLTLRRAMAAVGGQLGVNPKVASLIELGGSYAGAYLLRRGLFMPWELDQVLDRDTVREGLRRLKPLKAVDATMRPRPKRAFSKVATLESSLYMRNQLLRDTDWASMAHGIEVRVPLVDSMLLNRTAALVSSRTPPIGKGLLTTAPAVALPATVANRVKTGFATPVGTWLQRQAATTSFKHIPVLAAEGCPWARRWAYGVATV